MSSRNFILIKYLTSFAAYSFFSSLSGRFNQSVLHEPSLILTSQIFVTKVEYPIFDFSDKKFCAICVSKMFSGNDPK